MTSVASWTLNDYDGQAGIVGVNIKELDASTFAGAQSAVDDMRTSIEAVTLGVMVKSEMSQVQRFAASNVSSSDPLAQRGNKWVVYYRDNSAFLDVGNTVPNPGYQKGFTFDIPTADLSFRAQGNDIVWKAFATNNPAAFDQLVVDIQALVISPYSGTAVVERIEATTRAGG